MKFSIARRLAVCAVLLFAALAALGPERSAAPPPRAADELQQLVLPFIPRYAIPVEEDKGPGGDNAVLQTIEDYWSTRVTYPTGQFSMNWLIQAAQQDSQVARDVPDGRVVYNPAQSRSPLALNPNAFTALGPRPLQSNGCQGCYAYGHVSGRVNTMAIDPVQPSVAYLGSVGGGVWKSTNCCTTSMTWTPMTDDPLISTIAIDDITIDPNNHNTVYAATGDLNFGSFSFGSAGILKSTDQGLTWSVIGQTAFAPPYPEPIGTFPQYQAVGKVRVDPRNSNNLIAGTKTGVFFSYDAGANWSGPCLTDAYNTQRHDVTGMMIRTDHGKTELYVAVGTRGFNTTVQPDLNLNGANGIYSTTVPLSGCPASWALLTRSTNGWPAGAGGGTPYPTNTLGRIDVAMAPGNPNYMYAQVQSIGATGGYQQGGQLGVWRTTDGGVTWAQRSTVTALGGCGMDYNQNWYDQGLAVDPNNPDRVYMDTFDIWLSTNGATSFTDLTCGYAGGTSVHVDQHALAYLPGSSSVLLAGSDGGAYVSTNAGVANPTFTQVNDTLNTIEYYAGDVTDNFANAASPGANGGAQDNGSSTYVWAGNPGPAMWQLRRGGDGFFARIEQAAGQRWYQGANSGSLYLSTTGAGGTYGAITGGWTGDTVSFIMPYEIFKKCAAAPCTHLIVGSTRVWETITGTGSWYINSGNLTKGTLGNRSFINQLAYAWNDQTLAIVGTNDGNVQMGRNLGAGTANTAIWVNVTGSNAVLPNRPVLDVWLNPSNPLVGWAAVGGFNENTPSTPGHVFQVTCTSNCASFSWLDKTGNLPNIPVDSIIGNPNYAQQVFAGTDWGLYYTNDITANPPTWYRFQAGLPNVMIWDMSVDRSATTLSLWTRARGAYAWPLPAGPVLTPTPTAGPSATNTPVPPTATNTVTATRTNTPVPPTATNTLIPPTATNTATATNTPIPPTATNTATATRTNTPVPPTATNTATATRTNTPIPPTATNTATATNTPVPPTATNTATATNTPVPPTATNTATNTLIPPTATNTPVPPTTTGTPLPATATNTPVPPTATDTPLPTASDTPIPPTTTGTPLPPTYTLYLPAAFYNAAGPARSPRPAPAICRPVRSVCPQ
jgi:hypothetical protein